MSSGNGDGNGMTKSNVKLLRLTISLDTDDTVEMAFVRALLTRLNILHARLHNGKLSDILGERQLSELYKKHKTVAVTNEQTSSNGMAVERVELKLLPAPIDAVKIDSSANQRRLHQWKRDSLAVTCKIPTINEQKMPMPIDIETV